jgi:hypothetical protein
VNPPSSISATSDAAGRHRPGKSAIRREVLLGIGIATAAIEAASAQTARAIRGPAAVIPLAEEEPAARILIDPPDAASLAQGRVVIQYRTENPPRRSGNSIGISASRVRRTIRASRSSASDFEGPVLIEQSR